MRDLFVERDRQYEAVENLLTSFPILLEASDEQIRNIAHSVDKASIFEKKDSLVDPSIKSTVNNVPLRLKGVNPHFQALKLTDEKVYLDEELDSVRNALKKLSEEKAALEKRIREIEGKMNDFSSHEASIKARMSSVSTKIDLERKSRV